MSNYKFIATNRRTGNEVTVNALDSYFGRDKYGYRISPQNSVLSEEEFHNDYEPLARDI